MDLKICSLNVRGLGDRNKRREIFNWLRSKKYSIYLLQEVHCVETTTNSWAAEWGVKQFLVVAQARKQEWPFSLIITLAFRFTVFFLTPTEDSLSV